MGRLTAKLVQTASKVAVTRNEYGDPVYGTTTSVPCLYRDISLLSRGSLGENLNIDGQLWFDADAVVAQGDVYAIDGVYYRIEKVTIARSRLRANDIEFYKCEVSRQRQVS